MPFREGRSAREAKPTTDAMDMEYMDPYRRRYPGMPVQQPFAGVQQQQQAPQQQPPHHQAAAQYPYWNPLMAYYQQQHRAAALMGQGNMHISKQAEPKPRLAKDEVELLETEFAKNQKPSSSTKRELAEQMGVEVPRINVGLRVMSWGGQWADGTRPGSRALTHCDRIGSKTAAQRKSRSKRRPNSRRNKPGNAPLPSPRPIRLARKTRA